MVTWGQERGEAARGRVGMVTRGQGDHSRGTEAQLTRGRNQALSNRRAGLGYAHQMRAYGASGRPLEVIVEGKGLLDGQRAGVIKNSTEALRISVLIGRIGLLLDL